MEKRQFHRIIFLTPAKLLQGADNWSTKLLDLSFKGALFEKPEHFEANEQAYQLRFTLAGSDIEIVMNGVLTHIDKEQVGLSCKQMDIDSMTHLRRLIELNLGNDDILHRDLVQLSHQNMD